MRKILLISLLISLTILSCNKKDDDGPLTEWPSLMNGLTYTQITDDNTTNDFHCRWSPDGTQIAFARHNPSTDKLSLMIYTIGSGMEIEVVTDLYGDVAPSWGINGKIAFDARETSSANSQIYFVELGNLFQVTQFTNTNTNCFRPAWSPNATEIVFSHSGSLYKQGINENDASIIHHTTNGSNPHYNSDGSKILYYVEGSGDDIYSIAPNGFQQTVLADGNSNGRENWASFSPDDTSIAYQLYINTQTNIIIKDIQSGEMTRITNQNDCRFPDWSPVSNTVVYSHDGNLWLVEF